MAKSKYMPGGEYFEQAVQTTQQQMAQNDAWYQQTVQYAKEAPQAINEFTQSNPEAVWIPLIVAILTSVVGPVLMWWLRGKRERRKDE